MLSGARFAFVRVSSSAPYRLTLTDLVIAGTYVPMDEHGQPRPPIKGRWDLASHSEI